MLADSSSEKYTFEAWVVFFQLEDVWGSEPSFFKAVEVQNCCFEKKAFEENQRRHLPSR